MSLPFIGLADTEHVNVGCCLSICQRRSSCDSAARRRKQQHPFANGPTIEHDDKRGAFS